MKDRKLIILGAMREGEWYRVDDLDLGIDRYDRRKLMDSLYYNGLLDRDLIGGDDDFPEYFYRTRQREFKYDDDSV